MASTLLVVQFILAIILTITVLLQKVQALGLEHTVEVTSLCLEQKGLQTF